jgi:hypothetical protein
VDGWILALVVVILVIPVVALLVQLARREGAELTEAAEPPTADLTRPRPKVDEFHVRGDDALVYFGVPLPDGPIDGFLSDLLVREAVEVLREKRGSGLPLEGITTVRAFGTRSGQPIEVGSLELEEPGALPAMEIPVFHPHASKAAFDPLAELASGGPETAPGLADVVKPEKLGPAGGDIRVPGTLEAGLRSMGTVPESMSAGEMVLGLLRLTGYTVTPGPTPDVYFAERAGVRTFVRVVDHAPGEYPELDEKKINEFVVGFISSGASRGLLVTDKFGPFAVYDRERREPRVRFLTRERLQGFVDALATS